MQLLCRKPDCRSHSYVGLGARLCDRLPCDSRKQGYRSSHLSFFFKFISLLQNHICNLRVHDMQLLCSIFIFFSQQQRCVEVSVLTSAHWAPMGRLNPLSLIFTFNMKDNNIDICSASSHVSAFKMNKSVSISI